MIPPVRCVSCVIENTKFDISFVNRFLLNFVKFCVAFRYSAFLIRVSYQFNRNFIKDAQCLSFNVHYTSLYM